MLFKASYLSVFFVFSLVLPSVARAQEEPCDYVLRKVHESYIAAQLIYAYHAPKIGKAIADSPAAKIAANGAQKVGSGIFHYLKATKYPIFGITDSVREFLEPTSRRNWGTVRDILKNRWEKDKFHLMTYAGLGMLHGLTGLSMNQFHNQTSGFDEDDGEAGLIIIVDNMDSLSSLPGFGTYIFETKYKGNPKAILLKDIALAQELPLKLKELSLQYKMPIKKIDIYADSEPGFIKHPYSNSSITDAAWDTLRFPGKPIQDRKDAAFWQGALYEAKIDDGIIARNAKIRYNSDYAGRGKEGDLYLRAIGNTYLRNGGTIYSSNVDLHPSAAEYLSYNFNLPRPWKPIRTFSDWMFPELGLKSAADLAILKGKMGSKDSAGIFSTAFNRSNEMKFSENTEQKRKFEAIWSSKLQDLSKPYHEINDYEDLEHYTTVENLPEEATGSKTVASMDFETETIKIKKTFDTAEHAKLYYDHLKVQEQLILPPKLEGNQILIQSKPQVYDILRDSETVKRAKFAEEISQNLKNEYDREADFIQKGVQAGTKTKETAKAETKTLKALYDHYSSMTGVYHYPWWGLNWKGEPN